MEVGEDRANGQGPMVIVRGLQDALDDAFGACALPSELSQYSWASAGQVVALARPEKLWAQPALMNAS